MLFYKMSLYCNKHTGYLVCIKQLDLSRHNLLCTGALAGEGDE